MFGAAALVVSIAPSAAMGAPFVVRGARLRGSAASGAVSVVSLVLGFGAGLAGVGPPLVYLAQGRVPDEHRLVSHDPGAT